MFRRSKIKITPKIPQTKSPVSSQSKEKTNGHPVPSNDPLTPLSPPVTSNEPSQNIDNHVDIHSEKSAEKSTTPSMSLERRVTGDSTSTVKESPIISTTKNKSNSVPTTIIECVDLCQPLEQSQDISTTTANSQSSEKHSLETSSIAKIPESSKSSKDFQSSQPLQSQSSSLIDQAQPSRSPQHQSQPSQPQATQVPRPPQSTRPSRPSSSSHPVQTSSNQPSQPNPSQSTHKPTVIKLTSKDILDRKSVTLYNLIHAPISWSKRSDKKKIKKSHDPPKENETDNNEDTMDSIKTVSSTAANSVNESTNDSSRMSVGPRVKVGADGQLILDEESLVIKKAKPIETESIEEPLHGKTTYSSFRKRPPTARWSKKETIEFYTALNLIGPDFSLMSNLFFSGKRSRTELKNKFRRENKMNKPVIEKALYDGSNDYCLAEETN